MKSVESTYDIIKRLKLDTLSAGDIVGIVARNREYFFAEFRRIEYLAEDVTYLRMVFPEDDHPHELSMNARYISRVDVIDRKIIFFLLNQSLSTNKEKGKAHQETPEEKRIKKIGKKVKK